MSSPCFPSALSLICCIPVTPSRHVSCLLSIPSCLSLPSLSLRRVSSCLLPFSPLLGRVGRPTTSRAAGRRTDGRAATVPLRRSGPELAARPPGAAVTTASATAATVETLVESSRVEPEPSRVRSGAEPSGRLSVRRRCVDRVDGRVGRILSRKLLSLVRREAGFSVQWWPFPQGWCVSDSKCGVASGVV